MNKTITINPALFIPNGNSTRKSKPTKMILPKNQYSDTKEQDRLIALMRNQQEKNFKIRQRLLQNKHKSPIHGNKSELDESINYLECLGKRMDSMPEPVFGNNNNTTLKTGHLTHQNVSLTLPTSFDLEPVQDTYYDNELMTSSLHLATPMYGCLKNGNLPTFKEYKQRITQRQHPQDPQHSQHSQIDPIVATRYGLDAIQPIYPATVTTETKSIPKKNRPTKQRKILRRTFKIGKIPDNRVVSVLISNRTIRKEISNRKQDLRETSMTDVKKFLIKHGFIKVGSASPNDVLRKMYEEASLVCGTIHNNNPEVLTFNYFNQ